MILDLKSPDIAHDLALNYCNQGKFQEAVLMLERVREKDMRILSLLVECYDILRLNEKKLKTLQRIAVAFPLKNNLNNLIKESKKQKKTSLAFRFSRIGSIRFPYDPDFKKELIDILIKSEKYTIARRLVKLYRNFIGEEKTLFYKGLIYQETGRKIKTLFIFRKMTQKYPFNILYRYFLSTAYQALHFYRKSENELIFVKDFLKNIPKLMQFRNEEQDTLTAVLQQMWDEVK